jgi:uncharacterized membrane protein
VVSPVVFWPSTAGLAFLACGAVIARKELATAYGLDRLVFLGPTFFAASLAAFGAEHLTSANGIAQIVPKWMPWHLFWVYFVGLALLAAALSLVARWQMALTAVLLGVMFLTFVGTIHVPNVIAGPKNRILWAVMLRDTSFAAGALALASSVIVERTRLARKGLMLAGRVLFVVPILFFGFEHFLHPEFAPGVPLAKLTPDWVPWRFFCADVVGAVLLVAGVSVLVNKWSRLATSAVGLVMVVLTVGLYLPIALIAHGTAAQIEGVNYVFDTLLFGGAALLVAGAMPATEPAASV